MSSPATFNLRKRSVVVLLSICQSPLFAEPLFNHLLRLEKLRANGLLVSELTHVTSSRKGPEAGSTSHKPRIGSVEELARITQLVASSKLRTTIGTHWEDVSVEECHMCRTAEY